MRTHLRFSLLLLTAAPMPFWGGCAELTGTTNVDYSNSAKGNYDRAMQLLKKENYPEAIKLFQHVRSKFTFSQYATLAELGIADANFGREKWADAIDDYRNFIKNHPMHERVNDGYAAFRVGNAFYKEIPGEWFMVPPAYEKDQGPVRDALRELSAFVSEYPRSPHLALAKKMEEDCIRRLAEHEFYVADFYMKKDHPAATVSRLEGLIKGTFLPKITSEQPGEATSRLGVIARDYLEKSLEPQVLLLLGRTYLKMNKPDLARAAFQKLIERHPADPHAQKARLYLDNLAQQSPH